MARPGGADPGRSAAGLNIALRPTPHFLIDSDEWWTSAPRDESWWQVWFEQYRTFALHHADLAARSEAQALILGGGWLAPALPGGLLADGSPSGVPQDAEARWQNLLAEVRQHYQGQLIWAMPAQAIKDPPAILKQRRPGRPGPEYPRRANSWKLPWASRSTTGWMSRCALSKRWKVSHCSCQ